MMSSNIVKFLLALPLFFQFAGSQAFDAPVPTSTDYGWELNYQDRSPRPTEPPNLDELLKRQARQQVFVAPDNTCGYVSGFSGDSSSD